MPRKGFRAQYFNEKLRFAEGEAQATVVADNFLSGFCVIIRENLLARVFERNISTNGFYLRLANNTCVSKGKDLSLQVHKVIIRENKPHKGFRASCFTVYGYYSRLADKICVNKGKNLFIQAA